MVGIVIKVHLDNGFAFVRGSDGLSRFVHVSDMIVAADFDRLSKGVQVTFTPDNDGARGNKLRAKQVQIGVHE
jgi:cold shock CspA family protein